MNSFANTLRWLGTEPHTARTGRIAAAIFCFVLSGCTAAPNLFFVQLRGVKAQGSLADQREQLEVIEVSPRRLAEDQARDLWIELTATRRVPLAEITEALIKDAATSKFVSSSQAHATSTYYYQGYAFEFAGGCLVKFTADRYGFPPAKTTAFVRLGSRKTGTSLSLPCSIETLEQVFGKADQIKRGFGW